MSLLRTKKGFTLIELLIVIAIIGILSAIVLANLNAAKSKARDAARIASLKQLENSLELYYTDNGAYPISIPGCAPNDGNNNTWSFSTVNPQSWIPGLVPKYIPSLPIDIFDNTLAVCGNQTTFYRYKSCDPGNYSILFQCAAEGVVKPNSPFIHPWIYYGGVNVNGSPYPLIHDHTLRVCRGDLGCTVINSGIY